jgi:hypothetical protein
VLNSPMMDAHTVQTQLVPIDALPAIADRLAKAPAGPTTQGPVKDLLPSVLLQQTITPPDVSLPNGETLKDLPKVMAKMARHIEALTDQTDSSANAIALSVKAALADAAKGLSESNGATAEELRASVGALQKMFDDFTKGEQLPRRLVYDGQGRLIGSERVTSLEG